MFSQHRGEAGGRGVSVGEALSEARIRAGLTIEEVSARSLIRETVITAMERDDYEACGGSMYINGYIRGVAAAIGIDPLPLIAEYAQVRRSAEAATPPSAQEAAPAPEPEAAPDPDQAPEPEPAPEPESGSDPESDLRSELPPEPEPTPGAEPAPAPPPNPIVQHAEVPEAEVTLVDMFLPLTGLEPEPQLVPPDQPPTPRPERNYAAANGQGRNRPAPRRTSRAPERSRPGRTKERRRLGLAVGLTIVVLAVVAVAVTQLVGHASHAQNTAAVKATPPARTSPTAAASPTQSPSTSPTAAPSPTPAQNIAVTLTPVDAVAFGPGGTSDGDNGNIADRAIDGSASTGWETDWYATASFGDDKTGTGLLVDMGSDVSLDEVTIKLESTPGADLAVKTGTSTASLTTQATANDAAGQMTLKLSGHARYILLWFTQLPPDGDGTYQANVYNITVKGYKA
jgi:cytoskeletal protein RodZ